jgi:hypothetical protein
VKQIILSQGQVTKVDDDDYIWLLKWKWHSRKDKKNNCFYAVGRKTPKSKIERMSRVIMGVSGDVSVEVDHKNHDTLDNQRLNLRVSTKKQNIANRRKPKNNTSGYKGVYWDKCRSRWSVSVSGKKVGYFIDLKEAAKAYDKKAKELFGEFAVLNFSGEVQ